MKKLFALLMVCAFAFAFVACGGGAKESSTDADTTAVETPAVESVDTTSNDTTTTSADTTAAQ